jgi:catechol 2,3-dioxygenase-like lactoylglutathione lyase family enzyme
MLEARNDPDQRIIDEGAAAQGPPPHRRDTPSFGHNPHGCFRPEAEVRPAALQKKISAGLWSGTKRTETVSLELRRVIVFTSNLDQMTHFYRDVVGLPVVASEHGWVDFGAGACGLALHAGKASPGSRPPKLVFYSADVAQARTGLLKRGLVRAGAVKSSARFDMCDCKDPDGNPFQISSRA